MMNTQNYDVQSIEIKVHPDEVFAFVADAKNDPRWSIGITEVDGNTATLETPNGEMKVGINIETDAQVRTVDTIMTMPDGSIGKAFSRVIENNGGKSSIFTFVLMAPPVPLEELEGTLEEQRKQLSEELKLLKSILEDN